MRWRAVEACEWRALAPFSGTAGFWISELYSPWKMLAEIVLDFLLKKDDVQDLQTFVNTSLAENWVEKGEAPEWEALIARRMPIAPGVVPMGGLFLTAGVDVQRDRLECEVVAWGRNRESWSVDYQIFEGKTSERSVWEKLEHYRSQVFPTENGSEMHIARMFVDSGDGTTTNDVYNWVRLQPANQVCAIKGTDKGVLPVNQPSPVDVTTGGRKIKGGLKIRMINVGFFKSEFYADLKKRAPTPEEQEQGAEFPKGYCHFPSGGNYGDEHFKQLCSEQLVTHRNRKTGRFKPEWMQTRNRNEALDCRIYARAAAYERGLDRMQEWHFKQFEEQLKPVVKVDNAPSSEIVVQGPTMNQIRNQSYFGDRTANWLNR
jgi:phage terminase large subunit GpA-like protein